jgi:hypothetical protein
MVAFVAGMVVLVLGIAICLWFGRRRPVGTPVTWGEAFVAGTFIFALMILAYGIIPHQWLDYADNELLWRPDRVLMGFSTEGVKMGDAAKAIGGSGRILISYQALRDIVAATLYIVFLGANVVLWSMWQKRGRGKGELEPASSRFGRPLVRKA